MQATEVINENAYLAIKRDKNLLILETYILSILLKMYGQPNDRPNSYVKATDCV